MKHLNKIRVWPKGIWGWVLTWRVVIKRIIESNYFENFMILAVLANTIMLGMDRYNIPTE